MKCESTILEIETIVNRIKNGDIDLQPDFQRGEIWTDKKKKKLIDSILRGWRIPPIHFVLNDKSIDEVLDGQQRLAAIRDFYDNKICIDGKIEPDDKTISELDGLCYRDLSIEWQRKFRQYIINIVRLTEYKPSEPAELFYRLNQPTALTSAEQRNAYIGITRNQIKNLSYEFEWLGASKETVGFSNSRLAYDEIISKFCYTVQNKTLKHKVYASDLSKLYREEIPFSDECISEVKRTLSKFMTSINLKNEIKLKLNKATLFSWFVFIKRNINIDNEILQETIEKFEFCRFYVKGMQKSENPDNVISYYKLQKKLPFFEVMLNTFNQRASMGSTDALSIIYRDIIINIFYNAISDENDNLLKFALTIFEEEENMNVVLDSIVKKYSWGESF